MSIRAQVWFIPGEDGEIIVTKDHWGADNGYETAVFTTRDKAIDFAKRRWGCTLDEILIEPEG